ncbi:MAG TPA: CDP-alcohol phosphatidyltransferase family protein [Bacillota bacterium]|nr:CDP-alcohol phosphatidyltransferase family protein [Bacillota bacterium]
MTVANWVTVSRILLAPFVFWSLLEYPWWLSVLLLAATGLTDLFDGILARKRNEISELGKILDPVADKLVIGAVLAALFIKHRLPVLLVWAFIIKESIQLLGGAFFAQKNHKVVPSNYWGKGSSALYFVGFFTCYFNQAVGLYIIIAALALSIVALATYFHLALEGKTQTPR